MNYFIFIIILLSISLYYPNQAMSSDTRKQKKYKEEYYIENDKALYLTNYQFIRNNNLSPQNHHLTNRKFSKEFYNNKNLQAIRYNRDSFIKNPTNANSKENLEFGIQGNLKPYAWYHNFNKISDEFDININGELDLNIERTTNDVSYGANIKAGTPTIPNFIIPSTNSATVFLNNDYGNISLGYQDGIETKLKVDATTIEAGNTLLPVTFLQKNLSNFYTSPVLYNESISNLSNKYIDFTNSKKNFFNSSAARISFQSTNFQGFRVGISYSPYGYNKSLFTITELEEKNEVAILKKKLHQAEKAKAELAAADQQKIKIAEDKVNKKQEKLAQCEEKIRKIQAKLDEALKNPQNSQELVDLKEKLSKETNRAEKAEKELREAKSNLIQLQATVKQAEQEKVKAVNQAIKQGKEEGTKEAQQVIKKAQQDAKIANEKAEKAQQDAKTAAEKAERAQQDAKTAAGKAERAQQDAKIANEKAKQEKEIAVKQAIKDGERKLAEIHEELQNKQEELSNCNKKIDKIQEKITEALKNPQPDTDSDKIDNLEKLKEQLRTEKNIAEKAKIDLEITKKAIIEAEKDKEKAVNEAISKGTEQGRNEAQAEAQQAIEKAKEAAQKATEKAQQAEQEKEAAVLSAEQAKEEAQKATKQAKEATEKAQQAEQEKEAAQENVKIAEDKVKKIQNNLKNKQEELDKCENNIRKIQAELDEALKNPQDTQEVLELKEKLKNEKDRANQAEDKLSKANRDLRQAEQDKEDAERAKIAAEEALRNAKTDLNNKQKELNHCNENVEKIQKKIAEALENPKPDTDIDKIENLEKLKDQLRAEKNKANEANDKVVQAQKSVQEALEKATQSEQAKQNAETERDNKQKDLNQCNENVAKIQEDLKNAQEKNETDKETIKTLNDKLNEEKNKAEQAKKDLAIAQADAEKDKQEAQTKLEDCSNKVVKIQTELTKAQTELEKAHKDKEKTEKENRDKFEQLKKEEEDKIKEIEQARVEAENKVNSIQKELDEARKQPQADQDHIKELEEKLKQQEEIAKKAQEEITASKKFITNLETALATATGSAALEGVEIIKLKSDISSLQTELSNAKTELEESQKKLNDCMNAGITDQEAQNELKKCNEKIAQIEKKLAEALKNLEEDTSKDRIENLEKLKKQLRDEKEKAEQAKKDLATAQAEAEKEKQEVQSKLDECNTKVGTIQTELEKNQKEKKEFEQAQKETQEKIEKIKQEEETKRKAAEQAKEEAKKEITRIQKELDEAQKNALTNPSIIKKLEEQLKQQQKLAEEAEKALNASKNIISNLESSLTNAIDKANLNIKRLTDHINELQTELSTTKEKLQETQIKLDHYLQIEEENKHSITWNLTNEIGAISNNLKVLSSEPEFTQDQYPDYRHPDSQNNRAIINIVTFTENATSESHYGSYGKMELKSLVTDELKIVFEKKKDEHIAYLRGTISKAKTKFPARSFTSAESSHDSYYIGEQEIEVAIEPIVINQELNKNELIKTSQGSFSGTVLDFVIDKEIPEKPGGMLWGDPTPSIPFNIVGVKNIYVIDKETQQTYPLQIPQITIPKVVIKEQNYIPLIPRQEYHNPQGYKIDFKLDIGKYADMVETAPHYSDYRTFNNVVVRPEQSSNSLPLTFNEPSKLLPNISEDELAEYKRQKAEKEQRQYPLTWDIRVDESRHANNKFNVITPSVFRSDEHKSKLVIKDKDDKMVSEIDATKFDFRLKALIPDANKDELKITYKNEKNYPLGYLKGTISKALIEIPGINNDGTLNDNTKEEIEVNIEPITLNLDIAIDGRIKSESALNSFIKKAVAYFVPAVSELYFIPTSADGNEEQSNLYIIQVPNLKLPAVKIKSSNVSKKLQDGRKLTVDIDPKMHFNSIDLSFDKIVKDLNFSKVYRKEQKPVTRSLDEPISTEAFNELRDLVKMIAPYTADDSLDDQVSIDYKKSEKYHFKGPNYKNIVSGGISYEHEFNNDLRTTLTVTGEYGKAVKPDELSTKYDVYYEMHDLMSAAIGVNIELANIKFGASYGYLGRSGLIKKKYLLDDDGQYLAVESNEDDESLKTSYFTIGTGYQYKKSYFSMTYMHSIQQNNTFDNFGLGAEYNLTPSSLSRIDYRLFANYNYIVTTQSKDTTKYYTCGTGIKFTF